MTSNNEIQTKFQVIKHLQTYTKQNVEVWDLTTDNKRDFIKSIDRQLATKKISVFILDTDA